MRIEEFQDLPSRDGYTPTPSTYLPRKAVAPKKSEGVRIRTEVRLGSLIAAGGVIWTAHEATRDVTSLWQLRILPPGPLEVCAIGILVWLHARYRQATRIN